MTRLRLTLPVVIILFGFQAYQVRAQTIEIKGFVKDVNTHQSIGNVNIFSSGSSVGATSDYSGRFRILIPEKIKHTHLTFKHIAYDSLTLDIQSLIKLTNVYLQPRVIPLQGVTIEGSRLPELVIAKDLPQSISLVESKSFEMRGYIDAGDLLKTDHSIQVDETLSGKKTASIRGGNSDEIIVLYNGVKMNGSFDNVFDFSSIDLADIERFEIIRGSNTALYGPDAFSGVINIVPRFQYDYKIRFQQRFGTYRSGNWGLQLSHKLNRLYGTYSVRRGRTSRYFSETDSDALLENVSTYHTANLTYSLSQRVDGSPDASIQTMAFISSSDYNNQFDNEGMDNKYQMFSLKYAGKQYRAFNLNASVSYRTTREGQNLSSEFGQIERAIKDQWVEFNVEETVSYGIVQWLTSYQYQNTTMDFSDHRQIPYEMAIGLESARFLRRHHGFVSILKIKENFLTSFFKSIEFNGSLRKDWVYDDQEDHELRIQVQDTPKIVPVGFFGGNAWEDINYKFAMKLGAYRNDFTVDSYISFGTNTKFPTLFQQISSPMNLSGTTRSLILQPEKNRGVEVNVVVTRDLRTARTIYGWQISGSFFQNHYSNKIRTSTVPDIPVMFYDNVSTARITGFETQSSLYFLRKKLTIDWGMSRYYISEKAAFPFKSDFKHTVSVRFDHWGYSLQCHWFREGEQVAWLRQTTGEFIEIRLPEFENIDVHLSKTFQISKLKLFANISGRNLLNDGDLVLRGMAFRDRRIYLTLGTQY